MIDELCDTFEAVLMELFGERPIWEGLIHFKIVCKVADDVN